MAKTNNAHHLKTVRLGSEPAGLIDHDTSVEFEFEGRKISALQGDTIASALYAADVRTFSRSFKYHRPRGLMCVRGQCPNCLVQVGATPNVRACMTPVCQGMTVSRQNAWPSADRDVLHGIERLSALLPVGFYYKTFVRPRFMWPYTERVIRKLAGLGNLDIEYHSGRDYERQYMHADVAVVGGGLAGMAAAREAAARGAEVALIDDQERLGGSCWYRHSRAIDPDGNECDGQIAAGRWIATIECDSRITVLHSASAFGLFEGNRLAILQKDSVVELWAQDVIVASGTFEQPVLFTNNDLPGVFLSDGALRLMHLYRVLPGQRIAVVGDSPRIADVALRLIAGGASVVAVATAQGTTHGDGWDALQRQGVLVYAGHSVLAAVGSGHVQGVALSAGQIASDGVVDARVQIPCDTIVTVGQQLPDDYLVGQEGIRLQDAACHASVLAELSERNIHLAGSNIGLTEAADIAASGVSAVASIGKTDSSDVGETARRDPSTSMERATDQHAEPLPQRGQSNGKKRYVCFCGDVTEEDICRSIGEGFDDIETLKRYSTITMGPCQGRMCSYASRAIMAREHGVDVSQVGITTARPPATPIPLGALAGPKFMVEARSPLFHLHAQLGATPIETGHWLRPDHYGQPLEEVRAVRENVGLIDVSTLGRIEIHGSDAGQFIERIYTGRFANLKVGKLRYGIICTESGAIMDEGVVCRLGKERFFVTTSTSGHESTLQWFNWWKAIWGSDVQIVDVTSVYGAVNLAGQSAREILQPLVDIDLAESVFPMLGVVEAEVAGVPSLLMRVGFVGELSYEIHFPSDFGEFLWSVLMEAGKPYGIRPFGVEAQKILRLEKGHLIVGQDTDGLVDPFAADLAWTVKLNKPEFVGKQSLAILAESPPRQKLVPFTIESSSVVPAEGTQVVQGGRSVGRVTSCRFSPSLGKAIGLGWIPAESALPGTPIRLVVDGATVTARVAEHLFDPEGERQKLQGALR